VHGRAVAAVRDRQPAGLRPGQRDEFLLRLRSHRGMADQHEGDGGQHADRFEVLQRIEGHLGIQAAVGRQRAGRAYAQGVAVGRRLGDDRQADVAARARAVVHHHLLAELLVEPRDQHAHDRVGTAAGREGHHHADRLFREVGRRTSLRQGGGRGSHRQRQDDDAEQRKHRGSPLCPHWTRTTGPAPSRNSQPAFVCR
jgi:hypothetical protein